MSNIFKKIKDRKLYSTIFKSRLFGFGMGLIAFALPLLILRYNEKEYKALILLLISVAVAIIASASYLLISMKSTRRLAKQIDKKFALKEKVQTMVEYRDENAAIYQLQRDNAELALKKVYRKASSGRGLVLCVFTVLYGIALTVTAFSIQPPVDPPPEVIAEGFEVSEDQLKHLSELSVKIRNSKMDEPYKENTAVAVDTMIDELKKATTVDERDIAINKATTEILKQTDESSVAYEIIMSLWNSESQGAKELARALNYYDPNFYGKYNDLVESFKYTAEGDDAEKISTHSVRAGYHFRGHYSSYGRL